MLTIVTLRQLSLMYIQTVGILICLVLYNVCTWQKCWSVPHSWLIVFNYFCFVFQTGFTITEVQKKQAMLNASKSHPTGKPKGEFQLFCQVDLCLFCHYYMLEIQDMVWRLKSCVMCGHCSSVHKHVFDHVCVVFHYYLAALEQH